MSGKQHIIISKCFDKTSYIEAIMSEKTWKTRLLLRVDPPVLPLLNTPYFRVGADVPPKVYEEMTASFNGNEVKIRIPKHTKKWKGLSNSQAEFVKNCTCDDTVGCNSACGEVMGSTYGEGRNKLTFQVPNDLCDAANQRTPLNSEMTYCREPACDITPPDAPKGVHACKIAHPDKDVFLLKIGKQKDEPDRHDNIEVELVTPRGPPACKPPTRSCKLIQSEQDDPCKKKKAKKGKKKKK